MTKPEFITLLTDGTSDRQLKLDACNYFISNYAVEIIQRNPRNPFITSKLFTKLIDVDIKTGSDKAINHAFSMLQTKIKLL